jgi:coatomer subunit beta'
VALWRESLSRLNEKAGQSLADPKDYENLFPGYVEALKTEQFLKPERQQLLPASECPNVTVSIANGGSL